MLNRRLIRIKVFKVLFSNVVSETNSLDLVQKDLLLSCEKTRELVMFMLNISSALARYAQERIELGLKKFQPTAEEAAPNTKFAENKFVEFLSENEEFNKFCHSKGLIWDDDLKSFIKKTFASIVEKDYYKEYMSSEEVSFEQDCDLFTHIFEEEFEDNLELESILEDMSLYWIDDLDYSINSALRLISEIKNKKQLKLPTVFIKDEDKDYALRLLTHTYVNHNRLMDEINANIVNWDPERIVAIDMTLIALGIAEATIFPNIPLKVTINEYVEISKFYSTVNSKTFVNGLLDKILQQKVTNGEIVKSGRGLIDS